jgi:hypothetical protein
VEERAENREMKNKSTGTEIVIKFFTNPFKKHAT